jgi:hypothetical protein
MIDQESENIEMARDPFEVMFKLMGQMKRVAKALRGRLPTADFYDLTAKLRLVEEALGYTGSLSTVRIYENGKLDDNHIIAKRLLELGHSNPEEGLKRILMN